VLSLRHFGLVLFIPWRVARGCRRIWRGELRFIGFGGATLLDRIGRSEERRVGKECGCRRWLVHRVKNPALTPSITLTRARGPGRCFPVGRRQPTRPRDWSSDVCSSDLCFLSAISGWFSLSLGAWRVGAEESGAAS